MLCLIILFYCRLARMHCTPQASCHKKSLAKLAWANFCTGLSYARRAGKQRRLGEKEVQVHLQHEYIKP